MAREERADTRMSTTSDSEARLQFLKAAQAGALSDVQRMVAQQPSLLHARSNSKGYSAMHFAAMGGSPSLITWLAAQGVPVDASSPAGVSPLQVALEYKRLDAARLLQTFRDGARQHDSHSSSSAEAPPSKATPLPTTSKRPAPRYPSWMASDGMTVHELEGSSEEVAAEAARLSAQGATIVWRRAALCPTFPADIGALGLDTVQLDTNVSPRADRRFVYFSPERLERGPYAAEAVRRDFAPMLLNQQMTIPQVTARHGIHAREGGGDACGGDARGGDGGQASQSGWNPPTEAARGDEAVYVMHKLLETATAAEIQAIRNGMKKSGRVQAGWSALTQLPDQPNALWLSGLEPLAKPVAEGTDWRRVGLLVRSAGWGAFDNAGLLLSGRDALTPTHYDGHHNVFMQMRGAKRFMLFSAEQTPSLYSFPGLHALDPLARVDLEMADDALLARWPRARGARGTSVVVEEGDVLVLPQGVWHQVHSLDAQNVSVNLLFKKAVPETGGGRPPPVPGVPPPLTIAALPPHRRAAALAELAKTVEGLVGAMAGSREAGTLLRAAGAAAATGQAEEREGLVEGGEILGGVRELLGSCLGPAKGAPPPMSVGDFLAAYFDPLRFDSLDLARTPS